MSTTTTLSTLLGPLTTTYTPSGSICESIHYDKNPTGAGWFALGAIGADSTSCMPTGFTRAPQYYYSPGICPSGYTPACSSFQTTNSAVTTVATCCPTGYVCKQNRGNDIYGCTSLVTANTVYTMLSFSFETIPTVSTTLYSIISSTITTSLSADNTWINAYGVIAARQSTDPSFISTTATTLSATASITTSMPSLTSTATNTATASSSLSSSTSGGLTTGAKAGIGVGVSIGVIALIILILVIFKMRKRSNGTGSVSNEGSHDMHGYTAVAPPDQTVLQPNNSLYNRQNDMETYKDQPPVSPYHVSELSNQTMVTELPTHHFVAEMPGDQRYHQ